MAATLEFGITIPVRIHHKERASINTTGIQIVICVKKVALILIFAQLQLYIGGI